MLNEFFRPRPNKQLIRFLGPINKVLCLKGLPGLRDVPGLNRIIGFRGICNVRHIDFPQTDCDSHTRGAGRAYQAYQARLLQRIIT